MPESSGGPNGASSPMGIANDWAAGSTPAGLALQLVALPGATNASWPLPNGGRARPLAAEIHVGTNQSTAPAR